eukprot:g3029.t1
MTSIPDSRLSEGESEKQQEIDDAAHAAHSPVADAEEAPPIKEINTSIDESDPLNMPPHGTEVYLGGIVKNATDAQIREFCEQKGGEVFSLRCPKDPNFPGQNRGYAFVTFMTREAAHQAIETLNQTEMKDFPEKKVSLILSQVKNRLFVGNIPREMTQDELKEIFHKEVKGVTDVELLMDFENMQNRGFCFVECYNHAAADLARRTLSRAEFKLKERALTVTWAEPRRMEVDHEKVKSIYVGNLPDTVTEMKLRDMFKAYGDVEKVVLPYARDGRRHRDYGFVHYVDRSCALKAIEATEQNPLFLDNRQLHVSMARPTTNREEPPYGAGGGYPNRFPPRSRSYGAGDHSRGEYPYRYAEGEFPSVGGPGYRMTLVPTYLPNGQLGFMFQETGGGGGGGPVRSQSAMSRQPYGASSRSDPHRYRPY